MKVKNVLSTFSNIPKLLKLVWDSSKIYTICIGFILLFQALLPPIQLWVGKLIVDGIVARKTVGYLIWLICMELGIAFLSNFIGRVYVIVQNILMDLLTIQVGILIMEKSIELDMRYYENPVFYNELQRAQQEGSTRPVSTVLSMFRLIQHIFNGIAMTALAIRLNWMIATLLIVISLPAFIVDLRYSQHKYFLRYFQTPESRKAGYFNMILTSNVYIKEVKLFNLGRYFIDRWRAIYSRFHRENRSLSIRNNLTSSLVGLISQLGFYGAYGYVVIKALFRHITLGDLTMYSQAFGRLQGSFRSMLSELSSLYESGLFVTNLFNFLSLKPEIKDAPDAVPFPERIEKGIEFKNVSFRYVDDGEMVLKGINLRINPGETVALVGENGAGKTTLVKLLTRLYDPTEGAILIDGVDIRKIRISDLTRNIGVIFQDFARYLLTVRENIGFGDIERMWDMRRIESAARKGGADELIRRLPKGYETPLGRMFEGGVELSIGNGRRSLSPELS
ncbi:ABC transporter ATP-binding protein [Candidatus Poribacteria bacterium]|nr:ABC transporter ATP-binding protein [Candidatus Poribacteria bacterium]